MPFFFLALVSLFHACRQCLPATCPKLLLSSWIGINSAGLLTNMEAESKSVASEKMWLSGFQESLWHRNPAPPPLHPALPWGRTTFCMGCDVRGCPACHMWTNYRSLFPIHSFLPHPSFQETYWTYPGRGPYIPGPTFSVLVTNSWLFYIKQAHSFFTLPGLAITLVPQAKMTPSYGVLCSNNMGT